MKTVYLLTALGAAACFAPVASAQTVRSADHQSLPTSKEPATDASWQRMHLSVDHKHVDNTLSFAPDGRLRVQFAHSKRGVDGRWSMQAGKMCLDLPVRGSECFGYDHVLKQGETAAITSDRGWTGAVTMLTDPTGSPLAAGMPVVASR